MDSRFSKIDKSKIDKKLRNSLFKSYYDIVEISQDKTKYDIGDILDDVKESLVIKTSFYGKEFNWEETQSAIGILYTCSDERCISITGNLIFVLPDEIDMFCTEHTVFTNETVCIPNSQKDKIMSFYNNMSKK